MKSSSFALAMAALATQASAYPAEIFAAIARDPGLVKPAPERRQAFGANVVFDPSHQYVSNTGDHKFVAPGPTDQRGPCPGLNAMANHGYIPHNGVATVEQFTQGNYDMFGVGVDLAVFLAMLGAVQDGDLTAWSIGGAPSSSILSPLAGLIGQPRGISNSHNNYEGDVSPTRGDLYTYGNDYLVVTDQFKQLYEYQADKSEEESNYDLTVLTSYRARRFNQSIAENPYFFNGPISGLMVQAGTYLFPFRLFANKSAEYPEGRLSQNVLKTFFSITGDYPDFKYTAGYESLPDNWYKRAAGDEYTVEYFENDVLSVGLQHPQLLTPGGNTGEVNTFAPIDVADLTGGVYDAGRLAMPGQAFCFALQFTQASPDFLLGTFEQGSAALIKAVGLFSKAAADALTSFTCPTLGDINAKKYNKAMSVYPGYTKLDVETGKY